MRWLLASLLLAVVSLAGAEPTAIVGKLPIAISTGSVTAFQGGAWTISGGGGSSSSTVVYQSSVPWVVAPGSATAYQGGDWYVKTTSTLPVSGAFNTGVYTVIQGTTVFQITTNGALPTTSTDTVVRQSSAPWQVAPTSMTVYGPSGATNIPINIVQWAGVAISTPLPVMDVSLTSTTWKLALDYTTVITSSVIYTAPSDKKFCVTDFGCTATSANTVWLFDGSDSTANRIGMKYPLAANGGHDWPLAMPACSSTNGNALKVSSTAGAGSCWAQGFLK